MDELLSGWERADIERLRWHWGDAYSITKLPGTDWQALYRPACTEPLRAATADELLNLIRADYATRTGPR